MVPLMVNIPLWQNRLIPAVREAKRNVSASQANLEQAENLTEYEVRDAYYRFAATREVAALYEHAVLPEAEVAFRSDQAGYEAGRTDALNLLDSERVYLNAKVMSYEAVAEAAKSLAALERAVGTDLSAQGGTTE
jgi:outer membrane protein TolC